MARSVTEAARRLLASGENNLDELRVHGFPDDEAAHDDASIERLYSEFAAEFDRVRAELARTFGEPSRIGSDDDEIVPLNGVFRFAVWQVENQLLFAAAAHEDRGVPILLMLGATAPVRDGPARSP